VRPGWALVTAAVGRGGHVLVTWLHGGRVRGRIARPGGGFGPVLDLGPDGRHYIAVGPKGRVLVATLHRVARFRDTLEVTLTGPMGAAPVTTRLVGSSESVYGVSPISRFDRAGRALVAWTDGGDTHVATFAAGPPTVETIEPAGVLDAMEVARSGRVALALRAPTQPSGEGEFVALRGRSGSFGQGEQATPGELRPEGASLAFDPLTGEPNLFYLQREVEDEPIDGAYVVERNGG
jgi:hypothetical protein